MMSIRKFRSFGATIFGLVSIISISTPLAQAHKIAFEPVSVPIPIKKIAAHSYYAMGQAGVVSAANEGFNSNAGFVVTREGVVVFDTLGTPALGEALRKKIRAITKAPIVRIVISHYHADHFYGLQAFKQYPVEVIAHKAVRNYLATDAPQARLLERRQSLFPWVNDTTIVIPPDRYLDHDESFILGGLTFRIFHVGPAHTPEDLIMLVQEDGVLFAGDLMFAGRIPYVGNADVNSWLSAIDRVVAFHPRVLVGGHGQHSTNAAKDLALTREYLTYLRNAMRRAVDDGMDFDQAYESTDWSRFNKLPAFDAANRGNAFGTFLKAEQESLTPLNNMNRNTTQSSERQPLR